MEYYNIDSFIKDRSYYISLDIAKKKILNGGLVVIPTDTIYCFSCLTSSKKSIEKIASIKGVKLKNAKFSIMIDDISKINNFVKPFTRKIYKVINKNLPGPFTFIFSANSHVPKLFNSKKKEIGIRIPNDDFCMDLLKSINLPLVVSSVTKKDLINKHYNDPLDIENNFRGSIDLLIDAGVKGIEPSTVVTCMNDEIEVERQGLGELMM